MQRRHQEIAGAVAGEHAARSIGTVRGGCEADQQQPCLRIAEPGHRPPPVDLVAKGPPLLSRDVPAVLTQPRAPIARYHRRVKGGQSRLHRSRA